MAAWKQIRFYPAFPVMSCAVCHESRVSARLAADLEPEPVHEGLDLRRGLWVFVYMVEDDGQQEGTGMLLDRHPFVGKHHPGPACSREQTATAWSG